MEFAKAALNNILVTYTVIAIILIILLVLIFKSAKENESNALYGIVLSVVVLIYVFFSVIPFFRDYIHHTTVEVEGKYINHEQMRPTSFFDQIGVYTVTLITQEGTLKLSTAPYTKDIFPVGEYDVHAYYAPNSKILLYIEIIS